MNREEWLSAQIGELRPLFEEAGYPLPEKIRVTCGFPSQKARSLNKAIGEWWPQSASSDGHDEILISPVIDDPFEAMGVLMHELCHAATPGHGHDRVFSALARRMWLEGKPTATVIGQAFRDNLSAIIESSGAYPHAALDVGRVRKVQSTRMIKASCPCCGYTVRLTEKWAKQGLPHCPIDGFPFAR